MTRTPISPELAAEILFLSDQTCCVCRDARRNVEIHHIDGDPSHNSLDNLAVLCKDCHSDAHTTQAFSRNLTPPLLRKYNESWREIVRIRIKPGGEEAEMLEYRSQVLLEIAFLAHRWLNRLLDLYPGNFSDEYALNSGDRWSYVAENIQITYSDAEWERYRPLFDSQSVSTVNRLEAILPPYGDALLPRMKLKMLRTAEGLRNERAGYLFIPRLIKDESVDANLFFRRRFSDSLFLLSQLGTMADDERKALERGQPDGQKGVGNLA